MGIKKTTDVMIGNSKVRIASEMYNSSDELVRELKNRHTIHDGYEVTNAKIAKKSDFYGVSSYNEAMELMRLGYQPTVDKLKISLKTSPQMGESKRVKFENNIYGFAPIVPLAMMGNPNSMINATIKPMKYKVIDVYYDISVHYGISTNKVVQAGQILLSTVLDLERQGYKFNLYAVQGFAGMSSKRIDVLCIKIKSSDRPFDIKRMSFPLTHPAMFRVVGFDWQGKSPITEYNGPGRGMTISDKFQKRAEELFRGSFGKNAVYIPCARMIGKTGDALKNMLIQK